MLHSFLADVTDPRGVLLPARISEAMRISMARLAQIAKVHRNNLHHHLESPAV
jgi:hypothetical protein